VKIDAFAAKAPRYFATAKDRQQFKRQAGLVKSYFGYLVLIVHGHVYARSWN